MQKECLIKRDVFLGDVLVRVLSMYSGESKIARYLEAFVN